MTSLRVLMVTIALQMLMMTTWLQMLVVMTWLQMFVVMTWLQMLVMTTTTDQEHAGCSRNLRTISNIKANVALPESGSPAAGLLRYDLIRRYQ